MVQSNSDQIALWFSVTEIRYFYDSALTAIRELYGSAELRLDSFMFQRIRFIPCDKNLKISA
jgi:hypothetical protein